MKLIIDVSEEVYKRCCVMADLDGSPTLKAIKNGAPLDDVLDKIRAELTEEKESYEKVGNWKKAYGFEKSIEIIEYVKGESE